MTDAERQRKRRERADRQFDAADAAVERAVATFISKIKSIETKWEAVAPSYIIERMLLTLCEEMPRLIDDPLISTT